jgi:soluble lytic murein transglycosylase
MLRVPSIIAPVALMLVVLAVVGAPPTALASQRPGGLDLIAALDALDHADEGRALELVDAFLAGPWGGATRAEARLIGARACLGRADGERALELLSGTEAELPEVADLVWAERAQASRLLGRWDDALAWWRHLLERWPESPFVAQARYGVGDALFALGRDAEAESAYQAALRSHPRSEREPVARLDLAVLAERAGRYAAAAAGYGYLAYNRPGEPAAVVAAARLAALVAAGRAQPATFQQRLARLDVLLSARSFDETTRELEALTPLADAASKPGLLARRAKLAYYRRDFDAAAKGFAALFESSSGRERLDHEQWLARTYSTAGRYDEAITVYLRVAARDPRRRDARDALFKAAWLSYHSGDSRRALELFGRFVATYPSDGSADEALWYMAWNAYRLGDVPQAEATLARLRDQHPDSSLLGRAWYWQGRFAIALGDAAGARSAFVEAQRKEPLGYYGVVATQRLRELEEATAPVVFSGGSTRIATAGESLPETAPGPEPGRDELPVIGDWHFTRDAAGPPWGAAALDWRSSKGARALRFIRLGLKDLAADTVATMPALPGFDLVDVVYARARMLYSLGDYASAFRAIELGFGDTMRGGPGAIGRRYFQLAYPDAHPRVVSSAAAEFSVSPLFILSVMRQESSFDERARSSASAHGLMQIIPPTAGRIAAALGMADYDDALLRVPKVSVRFGAWYLAELLRKFGGNPVLALATYNAGPQAVESWVVANARRPLDEFVEDIPFKETRHYVKRVVGNLAVYAWLYGGKHLELPAEVPSTFLDNVEF